MEGIHWFSQVYWSLDQFSERALIAWFNLDPAHKCFITGHINDYPLVIKVGSWNLSLLLFGFSWSRKLTAIVLSCKNWSYPKVVPRMDFGCQKWSPRTTFGCQKWSHLAKTGPSRTNQNQSGGTLLVAESGLLEQFGLLWMVLLPYSDCWEGWVGICKQFTWNINRKDIATQGSSEYS